MHFKTFLFLSRTICINSGDLALAYAITAKPDSSLYPAFCDFFIWMTPFPTGDDVDALLLLSFWFQP